MLDRRFVVLLAALFLLGCLSFGGSLWIIDRRAEDRTTELEQLRTVQEQHRCVQANVLIDGMRGATVSGLVALLDLGLGLAARPMTPELRAEIITTYSDGVAAAIPFRDCSAAGITKYLNRPPPDPATSTTTSAP